MTNKQKQCLLVFLEYDTGGVDGIWGEKSRHATECAQEDLGLTVDGAWGIETETAVLEAVYTYDDNPAEESSYWDGIEYFTRDDFGIGCPCGRCGGFPVEPVARLMRNADAVRKHFGRPMIPSSTVRCQAHNAELKGSAPNSLHMRGKAMDFAIPGISSGEIVKFVKTLAQVHEVYAINGSYVHMGVQKY